MSGLTCGDHGSKKLGESPLCLAPASHPLGEFFSYSDGRVAVIKNESGGKVTFEGPNGQGEITLEGVSAASLNNTRKMQSSEVGDCAAQNGSTVSFEILPTDGNITWMARDQVALNPLFGGRTGRVFLCSDRENHGAIAINNSKSYNTQVIRGFQKLRAECSSLLGEGSADKCAIIKSAAQYYVPKSQEEPGFFEKHYHTFLGILVLLAFGTHGYKQWGGDIKNLFRKGPAEGEGKGPNTPKGPGGGGKGSPELSRDVEGRVPANVVVDLSAKGPIDTRAEAPIDARSTWMTSAPDFSAVLEPEIIERFEKYGVVPVSKGGLMYQYQASIDGVRVGLPAALGDLHGVSWTSDDFEKRIHEVAYVIPVPFEAPGKFMEGSKPLFDTNGELFETTLETNQTRTAVLDGKVVSILDHPGLEEGSMYKTVNFENDGACSIAYEKVGEVYSGVDFSESRGLIPGISINEPVSVTKVGGSFETYGEFEGRFEFTAETTVEQMIITLGNQEALFTEPKLATIFKNLKELSKDTRFQKVYNAEQKNYVIRALVEARLQEKDGETIKTWQEIDEEVWRSKIQPERMKVSERAERATSVVRKSEERRREAEKSEKKFDLEKEAIKR